jgi:hypothetical protein
MNYDTVITKVQSPAVLNPVAPKIKFVRVPTIIDRDFDMANHVKLLGVIIASAVTLATSAVFLFM